MMEIAINFKYHTPYAENLFDSQFVLISKQGNSFPEVGQSFREEMVIYGNKNNKTNYF